MTLLLAHRGNDHWQRAHITWGRWESTAQFPVNPAEIERILKTADVSELEMASIAFRSSSVRGQLGGHNCGALGNFATAWGPMGSQREGISHPLSGGSW